MVEIRLAHGEAGQLPRRQLAGELGQARPACGVVAEQLVRLGVVVLLASAVEVVGDRPWCAARWTVPAPRSARPAAMQPPAADSSSTTRPIAAEAQPHPLAGPVGRRRRRTAAPPRPARWPAPPGPDADGAAVRAPTSTAGSGRLPGLGRSGPAGQLAGGPPYALMNSILWCARCPVPGRYRCGSRRRRWPRTPGSRTPTARRATLRQQRRGVHLDVEPAQRPPVGPDRLPLGDQAPVGGVVVCAAELTPQVPGAGGECLRAVVARSAKSARSRRAPRNGSPRARREAPLKSGSTGPAERRPRPARSIAPAYGNGH